MSACCTFPTWSKRRYFLLKCALYDSTDRSRQLPCLHHIEEYTGHGRAICRNPIITSSFLIHGKGVKYRRGWSGETSHPRNVLIDRRKMGTLSMSEPSGDGISLRPGSISDLLSCSRDVRLEAANAPSEGSKMISGFGNVLLILRNHTLLQR